MADPDSLNENTIFNLLHVDTVTKVNACASRGLLKRMKELLELGQSPTNADNRGWKALHYAADGGHINCIEELVKRDDVEVDDETFKCETPLLLSIQSVNISKEEKYDVAEALLKAGANPNGSKNIPVPYTTILNSAIYFCDIPLVELLLKFGANINLYDDRFMSCLHAAAGKCGTNPAMLLFLLKRKDLVTFHRAFFSHTFLHEFIAQRIPHNTVSPEFFRKVIYSKPQTVALINEKDKKGNTLLHIACNAMDPRFVEILLNCGADPNITDGSSNLPVAGVSQHMSLLRIMKSPSFRQPFEALLDATAMSELKKNYYALVDQKGEYFEAIELLAILILFKRYEKFRIALPWIASFWFVNVDAVVAIDDQTLNGNRYASIVSYAVSQCEDEHCYQIIKELIDKGYQVNATHPKELSPIVALLHSFDKCQPNIWKERTLLLLLTAGAKIEELKAEENRFNIELPDAFFILFLKRCRYGLNFVFSVVNTEKIFGIRFYKNFSTFINQYMDSGDHDRDEATEFISFIIKTLSKFSLKFYSFEIEQLRTNFELDLGNVMEPKKLFHICSLKIRKILRKSNSRLLPDENIDNLCDSLDIPNSIRNLMKLQFHYPMN